MTLLYLLAKAVPVVFTALLPVVNPVGTSIILLSLTADADDASRRILARKIGINTVILLTLLLLGGSYLLAFFGISVPIVQTAGGLVLASMGWRLMNQEDSSDTKATRKQAHDSRIDELATNLPSRLMDQAFYPFTFPFTVGPGCVAVVLTLSAHFRRPALAETGAMIAGAFVGILAIGYVMYLCFAYSRLLSDRLGPSGTKVLLRLIAFVVVCIGAEICWNGVGTLLRQIR